MTRDDISIAAIWGLLLVAIGATVYGVLQIAIALLPAVIAGLAALMTAILTHALTKIREQQLKQHQVKQDNYRQILEYIAPYVREAPESKDQLDTAHLLTWIIGPANVIEATQQFTRDPSTETLAGLLAEMRHDLGIPAVPKEYAPFVFQSAPPPPPPPKTLKRAATLMTRTRSPKK